MGSLTRPAAGWRAVETALAEAARTRDVARAPLRAWLVGPASPPEAFGLALRLAEVGGDAVESVVFVTADAASDLAAIRDGRLDDDALAALSPHRCERFFERVATGWRARVELRARVATLWWAHLDDPPFRELDLVVCHRPYLAAALPGVRAALREGGLLVLGGDASGAPPPAGFEPLDAAGTVCRRVPLPTTVRGPALAAPRDIAAATLAAVGPPAVLVDEHGRIRHLAGVLDAYLQVPPGPPTDALHARLRPDLRAVVDAALREARATAEATLTHVEAAVRVRAVAARGTPGWYLLRFEPLAAPALDDEVAASLAALAREATQLRGERDQAAAAQKATHRELAAAHEDALAANEELRATNAALERARAEAETHGHALAHANAELERRLAELQERTDDLDNFLASTDAATLLVDHELKVRRMSPAMAAIVPLAAGDLGRPLTHFAHRLADSHPLTDAERVLRTGEPARRRVATIDGRWFVQGTRPYRAHDDRIDGLVLTFSEVTELELARLALAEQREFADHIIDTLREPLLVLDRELRVRRTNDAFRRHFARTDAELVGRSLFALDDGGWDAAEMRRLLEDVLPRDRDFENFEIVHDSPALGRRTLRLNARRIDHLDRILLAMQDVTDEKAAQARIEHLALRDPLTDLPNRTLLDDRLARAFAAARRSGRRAALMILDLDGFKDVNDTLGHPAGDVVLKEVARRLAGRMRAQDTLARLGGDEFAVVLADVDTDGGLETAAHRLMAAFAEPFAIDGHEARLSVSSGIALFPDDGDDATTLMRHADLALYRAKAAGRRQFRFFEPEMNAQAQRRRRIEAGLREALAHDRFTLHYQPQFDLDHGMVTTVEALLRWRHPEAGLVPPGEFINVAETSGLVRPIGLWVIDAACRQLRRWREKGFVGRVAVNLSPAQIRDGGLVAAIDDAVARHGLVHDDLELELVETLLVDPDMRGVADFLDAVARRGIRLAVDDFGRGYSALGYLQRLPVQKIKIDRTFVAEAADDAKAAALLEAMVGLGRTLEKTVVAEGVETAAELALLRRIGCAEVQGFMLAAPAAADAVDLGLDAGGG